MSADQNSYFTIIGLCKKNPGLEIVTRSSLLAPVIVDWKYVFNKFILNI